MRHTVLLVMVLVLVDLALQRVELLLQLLRSACSIHSFSVRVDIVGMYLCKYAWCMYIYTLV